MRARIDSLSYGPHALAREAGKVYFVRHAAPGDEVEIEVREDRRSFAYADMTALHSAGGARRVAPCEYLPRCGGCPWQHVDYAAQLEAKQRAVGDLLARIAHLPDVVVSPILPAPAELGYRRRLSLRVESGQVGYFAAASHDLVPVEHCLLAAPELDGAIALAQAWVGRLATQVKRIEIAAAGDGEALVLAAQAEGSFRDRDDEATRSLLGERPRLRGIALRGRGWRRAWGEPRLRIGLGAGEHLELPAGSFVQVNEAANAMLVSVVLELAALRRGEIALDLYAGFGNLAFPLARAGAEVIAVERDRDGVRAASEHARRHRHAGLEFVAADVVSMLDDYLERGGRADVVVLDPPRNGAAAAVERLLRLAPSRIVYVSCNPATLARDLAALAARYRVERVQPIDFFPQTYHVETVVELRLTDG